MIRMLNNDFRVINLTEARRNPDQNPKISAYEALKPYKDNPDMFISFTKIDKLGINPKSDYNTPLGIYCYPLKEIWKEYSIDQKQSVGRAVPFAGKSPYIWLIRKKSSTNFIDDLYTDYTSKDYDNDTRILIEDIENNSSNYEELEFSYSSKLKRASEFFSFQTYIKDLFLKWTKEANQTSIASKTWNITRNLAKFRNYLKNKPMVQWNIILREVLGYDGVADKSGRGIIHTSEPLQAVFFHKRAFEVIGEFLNKDYKVVSLPDWTKEAKTKDFTFKIVNSPNTITKTLVLGFGGTWLDGIWEKGIWKTGIWKTGIWKKGTWNEGIWKNGIWKDGIWKIGTWLNGNWKNGIWKKGIWENGTWENGTWKDGIWKDGIWKNGDLLNGDWLNGTWLNGDWYIGTWKKGIWKGGTFRNGIWKNGIWIKGTFEKSTWENGTWKTGFFERGIWENGTWKDGTWKDGTWKNGTWKEGWIFDPGKIGNFLSNWKWKDEYVKSLINPKDYFDKNYKGR